MEAKSGNDALAAELGTEAGRAVTVLLDELADPDLRQSFEAQPDVQEALAS